MASEVERLRVARNIVNQLFDHVFGALPGKDRLPKYAVIDARQKANDDCDQFAAGLLAEREVVVRAEDRDRIADAIDEHRTGIGSMHNDDFVDGLETAARIARNGGAP